MQLRLRPALRDTRGRIVLRKDTRKRTKAPFNRMKRTIGRMATFAATRKMSNKFRKFNTTLGQKLKRENRLNKKLVNMGGCSITRFLMQNMSALALTDVQFDKAGFGYSLQWAGIPRTPIFDDTGSISPTQTALETLDWNHQGCVAFLPQHPGSEACFNIATVGSASPAPTANQRFGVIPNYNGLVGSGGSENYADNYQYNQICMKDTFAYNTNQVVAQGTTWDSGNTLKVFRSWIRIDLENPNYQCGMKVHILVVRLRTVKFSNFSGCDGQMDLNRCLSDTATYALSGGSGSAQNVLEYLAYQDECRGKLPSKIFRVLKHKVVTLGPQVTNMGEVANPATSHWPAVANRPMSPKSCKTVTMSFGPKTIRRSHCSNMGDNLFTFSEMQEQWANQSIVLMYTEPADALSILPNANASTFAKTKLNVNYRIHKTNKWKVLNNFSN